METWRGILGLAALAAALGPEVARPEALEPGEVVEDVQLQLLGGGTAGLVERGAAASVLVFFRPGQDHSLDALRAIGECQTALAGKPVSFAGVVSGDDPPAAVREALAAVRATIPVLLDAGDALYARLGVRAHPTMAILDKGRRLVGFEHYRAVGYCESIRARVRRVLGEISEAELAQAAAPAPSQLPGKDPLDVARRHVRLGRKLLESKLFAQAHEQARKSLGLGPSAEAWSLEGDVFAAEGKCADAARAFDSALKLDPGEAAALAGKRRCAP